MLQESASAIPSSIWETITSWFTPTVLFLLLNLMIGTIAFTSSFSNKKHPNKHDSQQPNNIARSPSVLQRLKSVNFYAHFRSQEPQDSTTLHHKQNPDSQSQDHYFFHHNPQNGETVHQSDPHYVFDHNPQLDQTQRHFDFEEKEPNFDDFQISSEGAERFEESDQSMDEVYSQLTDAHFNRTKSDSKPASGEIPTKLPAKMKKSASSKSAFAHFKEDDIVEARRPATVKEKGSAKATDADEEVDAKADDFINRFKQQLKLQRLDSIIRYKDMIGRGASAGR